MSTDRLAALADARGAGVTSVCSAHELVIEAALLQAAEDGCEALIEATCNQVNQDGGYTGMTPADFRGLVLAIAGRVGFPPERVVLGGDHLGPNPWRHLPAAQAMEKAEAMVAAYAAAGFAKLHLDASMGCEGEPDALADDVIAARAVRLAARAEAACASAAGGSAAGGSAAGGSAARTAAGGAAGPVYVIGTEVPTPGGATEGLEHLRPTTPDAALATYAVHERAFRDLPAAWSRVLAMVVQPGVEFGHESVAVYRPERAACLSATLRHMPGLVFEAHSTDYQPEDALRRLVVDGFRILKVGPGLTFALREALYGLDAIDAVLSPGGPRLASAMEAAMLAQPRHWQGHYPGDAAGQRVLRHYSYSDRIRYYWPAREAGDAVGALLARLGRGAIPHTLLSQYLPRLHARVADGRIDAEPRALLVEAVRDVLRSYSRACGLRIDL